MEWANNSGQPEGACRSLRPDPQLSSMMQNMEINSDGVINISPVKNENNNVNHVDLAENKSSTAAPLPSGRRAGPTAAISSDPTGVSSALTGSKSLPETGNLFCVSLNTQEALQGLPSYEVKSKMTRANDLKMVLTRTTSQPAHTQLRPSTPESLGGFRFPSPKVSTVSI